MTRYIRFDLETRNILGIDRNKPTLSSNYFEVQYSDVEQFITGDQSVANYYIEKDRNQSKYYIKPADFAATNGLGWRGCRGYPVPKSCSDKRAGEGVGVPGQTFRTWSNVSPAITSP